MLHAALYSRHLPDLIVLTLILLIQAWGTAVLLQGASPSAARFWRRARNTSFLVMTLGYLLRFEELTRFLPGWAPSWGRAAVLAWAILSVPLVAALLLRKKLLDQRQFAPDRRQFLHVAQAAIFGAPVAALGYGVFIQRFDLKLREQDIYIPGLPQDLHGLKLVQLTDIHLSPFLSERELEQAIGLANDTQANVALVTGDLISNVHDPLDACLRQLTRLRAEAGVYGCLGNHEIYAEAEDYVTRAGARLGLRFLRQQNAALRFGRSRLNFAGVDYQRMGSVYLPAAERLVDPEAFNVLLSHNPDVFPVAAQKGFGLTISGHTHGGQIGIEILKQNVSVARFFTPYVDGQYRLGDAQAFVSRGIGTIGLPARVGAPPEVALLRLWRT